MKLPTILALGAALVVSHAPVTGQDPLPAGVKEGYVKLRVEVEARGVLKVSDKSAVIFTRFRYFDHNDAKKEVPAAEGIPPYSLDLDFSRAPEMRDLAKVLDGKEVIVTGLGELRSVAPPPVPPGGFTGGMAPPFGFYIPGPSWRFQPPVLVTGIRPVAGKK
ncbi:hypothetical protein J0H58_21320 [bacterium]|nr:hypothetical protein [bacterium]